MMHLKPVARHKTAIRRPELSRPLRLAIEDGLLSEGRSVFDYGCGHGDDLQQLEARGFECSGWDPVHRRDGGRRAADLVNLGYVVNVIEDPTERRDTLQVAYGLAEKALIVSARLTLEEGGSEAVYSDGCLTRLGTFQKFFEQQELREWIDASLGVSSLAAAPGVFYVFKDAQLRESFAASRYRRRIVAPRIRRSDILFEEHREILEPLIEFLCSRGRLPDERELTVASEICENLGSIKRAFGVIRHATDDLSWQHVREERAQDLLVYLGLLRFGQRPKYRDLPLDLRLDVKAFFLSYKTACAKADELLFSVGKSDIVDKACRESKIGKLTNEALYVHQSALDELSPILRTYEGCARAYVGAVEGANLIKLHRGEPRISYLAYPDFDKDPHPALAASLMVPLQTFRMRYRRFDDRQNPPILHRKELFVGEEYPGRQKFARLTQQEERAGLFDDTRGIGTRAGWGEALEAKGFRLRGHRVERLR